MGKDLLKIIADNHSNPIVYGDVEFDTTRLEHIKMLIKTGSKDTILYTTSNGTLQEKVEKLEDKAHTAYITAQEFEFGQHNIRVICDAKEDILIIGMDILRKFSMEMCIVEPEKLGPEHTKPKLVLLMCPGGRSSEEVLAEKQRLLK